MSRRLLNKRALKRQRKGHAAEEENELTATGTDEVSPLLSLSRLTNYWKKNKYHLWINPPTVEHKGRVQIDLGPKKTRNLWKAWKKSQADEEEVFNVEVNGHDAKSGHFVRVFSIKGYPPSILVGYLDHLEDIVNSHSAILRKTIRYAESPLKWNMSMRNHFRRLARNISEASETDPAREAEVKALETIRSIRDATLKDNRKLVEVTTFLTVSAKKLHQLDNAEAALKQWFNNMDGELDNLRREQPEAMRQTSPVFDDSTKRSRFFNKRHYGRVLTDDVAAATYPMTRGSFSDEEGPYFGRRTEDGSFCFINIIDPNDTEAQNITVFGKTGSGKSFFLKALVVSLLQENVHVFIFDLDGEWRNICEYVGGIYVDQTAAKGNYFEPMTIMDELPGIDKDIREYNENRYTNAMNMTIRTFSLLAGNLDSEHTFEVGEAAREVYKKAGIEEFTPSTWNGPFSEEVRPTIHKLFKELKNRAYDKKNVERDNALFVYNKVKLYFEGIYHYMFRTEEKLIFDKASLVVYKVGNGITTSDSEDQQDEKSKQAQLKMSMAFDIVNAQIAKLKVEGAYFSAVLVDEGQRQLKNAMLRRAIFDWYTAIRKLNGMMILASNTPAIMLDTAEGEGMWENTNVKVFFYMANSAIRSLSQHSTVPREIQEAISQSEGTQTFILEYKNQYDQLFMDVPPEERELYKTRELKNAS